ncbi:hypothetical protein FRC00_007140, partial [Tulasnella sp. 408]
IFFGWSEEADSAMRKPALAVPARSLKLRAGAAENGPPDKVRFVLFLMAIFPYITTLEIEAPFLSISHICQAHAAAQRRGRPLDTEEQYEKAVERLTESLRELKENGVLNLRELRLSVDCSIQPPAGRVSVEALKIGSGGYGEVCLAKLDGWSEVAVKELRIIQAKGTRVRVAMRLARELKVWAKAQHPNILKLLGYHLSENYSCAQFVSPYMRNGNIKEFMGQHQVSVEARLGFANVLISDKPDAVLCDFGLATFVQDAGISSGLTTSRSTKGSSRYMSPELFQSEDAKHTLESDIWAWACTTFEIITDVIPYNTCLAEHNILGALIRGISPGSVELLGDQVDHDPWRSQLVTLQTLITECWSAQPKRRPYFASILKRLQPVELGNPNSPRALPAAVQAVQGEFGILSSSMATTPVDTLGTRNKVTWDPQLGRAARETAMSNSTSRSTIGSPELSGGQPSTSFQFSPSYHLSRPLPSVPTSRLPPETTEATPSKTPVSAPKNKGPYAPSKEPGQYWSEPPMHELRNMSLKQLGHLEGFKVHRNGFGHIEFLGPVDLTNVKNLEDIPGNYVIINAKECTVYPDDDDMPSPGEGLNVPARISLVQCWPVDKATQQLITDPNHPKTFAHVKKLKGIPDTTFRSYEALTGTWVFEVPHFSRYGLDDDEEEVEIEAPQEPATPFGAPSRPITAPDPSHGVRSESARSEEMVVDQGEAEQEGEFSDTPRSEDDVEYV